MKLVEDQYEFFTLRASCAFLSLSQGRVSELVRQGRLEAVPVHGYTYVITRKSLEGWKAAPHPHGPPLREPHQA